MHTIIYKDNKSVILLESVVFIYISSISADPLAQVTQQFREHLLERSLYSLVTPGNRSLDGGSQASEIVLYTQLLTEASSLKKKEGVTNLSSALEVPG